MGLIRTFVDHPAIAEPLEQIAAQDGATIDHKYVRKLLDAFAEASQPPQTSPQPQPQPSTAEVPPQEDLIEPLRAREIEVLEHVAVGRSNKEIADEMIMAVSTVKWYLRNIYDKLQVHRRTQAVARARELNLL